MSTPKVVIMGKGKANGAAQIQSLISAIDPDTIPLHLPHSVQIQTDSGSTYRVDKKHFKQGVKYNNIQDQISALGLKEELSQIEIILDLDKAYAILTMATDSLLASAFGEDTPDI